MQIREAIKDTLQRKGRTQIVLGQTTVIN
jgi:hypothetical protein